MEGEDLPTKIRNQIDYYFSDLNLKNDKFMMKTIEGNPDKSFPINTLLKFNKVKALTDKVEDVIKAVNDSAHLVLSEDQTKVMRKIPYTGPIIGNTTPGQQKKKPKTSLNNANQRALNNQQKTGSVLISNVNDNMEEILALCKDLSITQTEPKNLKKSYQSYTFKFPQLSKDKCLIVHCENSKCAKSLVREVKKINENSFASILGEPIVMRESRFIFSLEETMKLTRDPRLPKSEEDVGFSENWDKSLYSVLLLKDHMLIDV